MPARILICYASTEGQTRKIARFCADQLFALGHAVEMLPAEEALDVELPGFDAAILAGSVHGGMVQTALTDFAAAHAPVLNRMLTLYLQVSLSAAGDDPVEWAEIDRIARRVCEQAGWRPGAVHQIAGAFRFTRYDFFKSWAMRYIAARKGEEVDPRSDKEYTDWAALSALVRDWAAALERPNRDGAVPRA